MSEDRCQIRCGCGIPAVKRTSWTDRNPGRRFICCKFYDGDTEVRRCEFFKWVDEDMTEWQRHLTNKLILEKKLLDAQMINCQAELKELQTQRSLLFTENDNLKVRCKALAAELKFSKKKGSTNFEISRISGSNIFLAMILLMLIVIGVVVVAI